MKITASNRSWRGFVLSDEDGNRLTVDNLKYYLTTEQILRYTDGIREFVLTDTAEGKWKTTHSPLPRENRFNNGKGHRNYGFGECDDPTCHCHTLTEGK